MPAPAPARSRAFKLLLLLIVVAAASLTAPSVANAATSRADAVRAALRDADVTRGSSPVLVHAELATIAPGTRITESATVLPIPAATDGAGGGPGGGGGGAGGDTDTEMDDEPFLGIRNLRGRFIYRTVEPSWLVWIDYAPYQQQQRAARIAIVGERTGSVWFSRPLRFAPYVGGVLPAFLRSTASYESGATRVYQRVRAARSAPRLRVPDYTPSGDVARQLAADLGAQRTCVVTFGDTFGPINDRAGVRRTIVAFEAWWRSLAGMDSGIRVQRYALGSRRSPTAYLARVIRSRDCQNVVVYAAGSAARVGNPAVLLGGRAVGRAGALRLQPLLASRLRGVIDSYPGARFTVVVDAPGAGRFGSLLDGAPNLDGFLAPANAGGASFAHVPSLRVGRRIVPNTGNPRRLLEFTNDLLRGMDAFSRRTNEVLHAQDQRSAGSQVGTTAWLLARSESLGRGFTDRAAGVRRPIVDLPVTVTPPGPNPGNKLPAADDLTISTSEDTPVSVTLNGSDADGEALTFALVAGPTNGTLAGDGASRTYTPAADFHGTDTFTYTATDPRGGISAPATVTITVASVNDPATLVPGTVPTYVEGTGARAIVPALQVADDSGALTAATVSIVGGYAASEEVLGFTPGNGITGSWIVGDGLPPRVQLNGVASTAAWQQALRSVTFQNFSGNPTPGPRTIRIEVSDGVVTTSAEVVLGFTTVLTPPTITRSTTGVTVSEDGGSSTIDGVVVLADPDTIAMASATVRVASGFELGDQLSVLGGPVAGITESYDPATGVLTLTGPSILASMETTLRNVQFGHVGDTPSGSPKTIGFTVTDADGITSSEVLYDATVIPLNDAPVVTPSGATLVYTEDDGAVAFDPGITITDPDDTMLQGVQIDFINGTFRLGQDSLSAASQNGITVTPNFSSGQLLLTGTSSIANYQAALRSVTYTNSSQDPNTTLRELRFIVTDVNGPTMTMAYRNISVTSVPDVATAEDDTQTVAEDSGATTIDVLANDFDVDGGAFAITGVTDPANGTVVITNAGADLTYEPDANYCNAFPTTDDFTYTVTGGDTATVAMSVTCVNDPLVAGDDSFTGANAAIGNTSLVVNSPADGAPDPVGVQKVVAGNILANDVDPDAAGPITVVPGTLATTDGGTVTLEADGDFTYMSDPADQCTDNSDSFTYVATDGALEAANGTVTIEVAGCVWYVDNSAFTIAGTSTQPFYSLASAAAASSAGDVIYVDRGRGDTVEQNQGITLKANQRLVGEAADLVVGGTTLQAGNDANRPTLINTNVGGDVVTLASGATVAGLRVDVYPVGGSGIAGTGLTSGVTIDDVTVLGFADDVAYDAGIELSSSTGTHTISNTVVSLDDGVGLRASSVGTLNVPAAGTVSITTGDKRAIDISGTTAIGTAEFDSVTAGSSTTGGILLTPTSGAVTFGDVSLTSTGGTGFAASGLTSLTIPAAGTVAVAATGGPAIDMSSIASGTVVFDTVASTNSAGTGVSLSSLGSTSVTVSGGAGISGSTGTALAIGAGTGTITFGAPIGDGAGASSVAVSGRSGGSVSISGSVTDSADANGGIALTSNTGATIGFSGGVTISSGAGNAFTASGGGTVEVTGAANTLASTTGTALNVANTTIGANDLTFRSISANGAANGIVLNATGTSGGLTVTGTGTAGTGGTIQNTSGAGIDLTSTTGVSLASMTISGGSDDGVRAANVAGLTIAGSSIVNNGDAANEDGIVLTNATGAVVLTNDTVTGSGYNNLRIDNTTGTSTLSITGGSYSANDAATGNHGILIEPRGTSTLSSATITGATIDDNFSMGIQVAAADTAAVGSLTIDGNDFAGTSTGATTGTQEIAIDVSKSHTSNVDFVVSDNVLLDHNSHGMNFFTAAGVGTGGTYHGTIVGNQIGSAADDGSGSQIGNCVRVNMNGDSTNRLDIDGNTLRECPVGRGIEVVGRNGIGTLDVTVRNNDVDHVNTSFLPGTSDFPLAAILVQSNVAGVSGYTVNADVRGNTVPVGTAYDFGSGFIHLQQSSTSTLRLQQTQAAADCAAHLAATNTGSTSHSGCSLFGGPVLLP